jgi:hypothetical protein
MMFVMLKIPSFRVLNRLLLGVVACSAVALTIASSTGPAPAPEPPAPCFCNRNDNYCLKKPYVECLECFQDNCGREAGCGQSCGAGGCNGNFPTCQP